MSVPPDPRDIFDILKLYEEDGLTDGIIECFVCYLAGHNRPIHEVLFANEIDITSPEWIRDQLTEH